MWGHPSWCRSPTLINSTGPNARTTRFRRAAHPRPYSRYARCRLPPNASRGNVSTTYTQPPGRLLIADSMRPTSSAARFRAQGPGCRQELQVWGKCRHFLPARSIGRSSFLQTVFVQDFIWHAWIYEGTRPSSGRSPRRSIFGLTASDNAIKNHPLLRRFAATYSKYLTSQGGAAPRPPRKIEGKRSPQPGPGLSGVE